MADTIALNLYTLTFSELSGFGATIHEGYIRLAAKFPSPMPTMPVFKGHLDDFNESIEDWGIEGNRGRHSDYVHVLSRAEDVIIDLKALAENAKREQPRNPALWIDLGFSLRKAKSKNQTLEMVQNFHHFISRDVPAGNHKLRWKKPLNTKTNLVRGYIIQANDTSDYPKDPNNRIIMMNTIGIVTETTFTDMKPLPGRNWYWVTPFNSEGLGDTSQPVMVVNTKTFMEG